MNAAAPGSVDGTRTFWPLLYLRAELAISGIREFPPGVRLIRADADSLGAMGKIVTACSPPEPCVFDEDVRWLLLISLPRADVPEGFRKELEQAVTDSFLLALRLVRPTSAVCPVTFGGVMTEEGVDSGSIQGSDDYQNADYGEPRTEWVEPFGDGDLLTLVNVWEGLAKLRGLEQWEDPAFLDRLFRNLNRRADDQAKEVLRGKVMRMPSVRGLPKPEVEKIIEDLSGGGLTDGERRRAFARELAAEIKGGQDSRIGRALDLFEGGLHVSPLHSFLSMCLILEVLWSEAAAVSHKLGVRIARTLAGDEKGDGPAS